MKRSIKNIFSLIEEIVNDKSKNYYTIDLLNKDAVFTSEGESYISNRLNNKDLFKIRKKYELKDYNLLPENRESKSCTIFIFRMYCTNF